MKRKKDEKRGEKGRKMKRKEERREKNPARTTSIDSLISFVRLMPKHFEEMEL